MSPYDHPYLRDLTHAGALALAMATTPGVRLTLTQGTPVTTTDVTGSTSIYAEPVNGGIVPMFRDAEGKYPCIALLDPSTVSLALGTLASATIPNDVFAYYSGGTIALEKLAWTNGTTRATGYTMVRGRPYKTGDFTRLLLGTAYPTSTTTTEDSAVKRFLSNAFNAEARLLGYFEATDNWSYNTDAWRKANNSDSFRVETVTCLPGRRTTVTYHSGLTDDSAANVASTGVGVNSTSTPSGIFPFGYCAAAALIGQCGQARYAGYPAVGYNFYSALEKGTGGGTQTWFGDNGGANQFGLMGECLG